MKLLLLPPFSLNELLLFKIFKISLIILFLSFSISSNLVGQVVIKERVEVDPTIPVQSKINNNTTQSHIISASVPWEAVDHIRVKLQIKNHCTGQIVDSGYELGGFAQVSMTATNGGSYSVTTIFEGWNTWGRNWVPFVYNHVTEIIIDGQRTTTTAGYKSFTPWYSGLSLSLEGDISCSGLEYISFQGINNCDGILGSWGDNQITYSISGGDEFLSLYDYDTGTNLGTSVTREYHNRGIGLRVISPLVEENDKNITITATMDGNSVSETITIKTLKEHAKYSLSTYPSVSVDAYRGEESRRIYVYADREAYCYLPAGGIPDETKYNLVITKGQEHGVIGYMGDGRNVSQTGTELYDLNHIYGGDVRFEFQAFQEPTTKDTVIVNISTTDPDIEPIDMEFHVAPRPFYAYAQPNPVGLGDTSKIRIKQFIDSEAIYADFPEDHEFYIELGHGWEYADLYSSYADSIDWYFDYLPGDFSLVTLDDIDGEDSIIVNIWIDTYLETSDAAASSQMLSKADGKISTVQKDLDRAKLAAKLRKETKAKIASEKKSEKGKKVIVYENERIKILQSNQGSVPTPTIAGSEWVYYMFDIIIKEKTDQVYYVKADFETESFSSGDTVDVIVKKVDEEGNESDFDSLTTFEVGIEEGCTVGYIIDADGIPQESYIESIRAPFRFVVNYNLTEEDTLIKLRVGVADDDTASYKPYSEFPLQPQFSMTESNNSKKEDPKIAADYFCSFDEFVNPGNGVAEGTIVEKPVEIMLGETKYFGIKKMVADAKTIYKIEEIPTSYSVEPIFPDDTKDTWKWVREDVWGGSPIEVLKTKSGVYWEKKYPKFEFLNEDQNFEMKMGNVKNGIIRVIGRFWEDGKEDDYKVNLKVPDKAEIKIKVVKPNKLLTKGQTPSYSKIRDVKDKEDIEIDEKCIEIGGKIGIPPQVIKGQMEKESSFRNAYRYEPIVDKNCQKNVTLKKRYFSKKFFKVSPDATSDSEKMGSVGIPSDHKNVKPVAYPSAPKLIREYISGEIIRYVVLASKERNILKPYFLGNEKGILTTKVKEYFEKLKKKNPKETDLKKLSRLARTELKKYIESDKYEDGKLSAQTRIMSSYGLLQQTFYAASDNKKSEFSVKNKKLAPELLNEIEYSLKAYQEKMTKALKDKSGLTWVKGFEAEINGIFASYNPGEKKYTKEALVFSKKYLPSK